MAFVRKSISITEEHDRFLKKRNLRLSKMVQKMLVKEIDDWNFALVTEKAYKELDKGKYTKMSAEEFLKKLKKGKL
jgi:hypothetical protein